MLWLLYESKCNVGVIYVRVIIGPKVVERFGLASQRIIYNIICVGFLLVSVHKLFAEQLRVDNAFKVFFFECMKCSLFSV